MRIVWAAAAALAVLVADCPEESPVAQNPAASPPAEAARAAPADAGVIEP
jgi:hypothetical protein